MIARQLVEGESAQFQTLWIEGLRRFPTAFLLTEQEARDIPLAAIEKSIASGQHWGVWRQDKLTAIASMRRGAIERLHHTADFGPFYVRPEAQGQGIGKHLLAEMLKYAHTQNLLQIELSVDVENKVAHSLYLSAGFKTFGTRKRSVIIDGKARDDQLMICKLDCEN